MIFKKILSPGQTQEGLMKRKKGTNILSIHFFPAKDNNAEEKKGVTLKHKR